MKNPLGNMAGLLKQAQAMQTQMAKVQEQAASKTVTGTAGGGSVTVTANGAMELVALVIAEKALEQYRGTQFEKPLLSAIRKIEQLMSDDTQLREEVELLKRLLRD